MTCRTEEAAQDITRLAAQDFAGNHIVGQLDQTNQWQTHGRGHEIIDIRLCIPVLQPLQDIHALGIELASLGLVRERLEQFGGGRNQFFDERRVRGVNVAQFIKVLLDIALTTEHRVDTRGLVGCRTEQGRIVGLGGPARRSSPGVVGLHDLVLLSNNAGERSCHCVNIIAAHEGTFKFIQREFQNFQVVALCIVFVLDLVSHMANVAGY